MASVYQYISQTELEQYKAVDYSKFVDESTDPDTELYPDTTVDAWITHAERLVNSYMRRTYDVAGGATVPDSVKVVTMEMAGIIADNVLIQDGYLEQPKVRPFLDENMRALLDAIFEEEKATASGYSVESLEDGYVRYAY